MIICISTAEYRCLTVTGDYAILPESDLRCVAPDAHYAASLLR